MVRGPVFKLAFYKAEKGKLFDKLIAKWPASRGPYSHVEWIVEGPANDALCFSSSFRDDGVRFKRIDLTSGKWDIVDVGVVGADNFREAITFGHSLQNLGVKYDWKGILGFVIPGVKDGNTSRFCSEVCTEVAQRFFGMFSANDPGKTSPSEMYRLALATPTAELSSLTS